MYNCIIESVFVACGVCHLMLIVSSLLTIIVLSFAVI